MLHKVAVTTTSLLAGACLLAAPAAARVLGDDVTARPANGATPEFRSTPRATATCGAEPTSAAGWERLFDAQSGSWSGGDGAASVRLDDGRRLWFFGDTFVGDVSPNGRRSDSTRIVRNSAVITDASCVEPVSTRHDFLPGRAATWLWPTVATVTGTAGDGAAVVRVFAQRLAADAASGFGFRRVGVTVATLRVPAHGTPAVVAMRDLPASDVLWGAAVLREGATTWVYGTRDPGRTLVLGRELLLARAPTATLTDARTWRYRTADGWSSRPADAAAIRSADDGVSTVTSVARVAGRYVAVTKAHEFLDDTVVALVAPHPWGPWRDRPLFTAPSTDTVMRYQPMLVSARVAGGVTTLRVVVSRTTTDLRLIRRDAEITRPTFVDVVMPR